MIKSTTTTPDAEVLLATQILSIDEVRIDKQHVLRTLSAALSDGPEFSSHQTFPLKYQLLEERGRYVLAVGDTGEDGLRILLEGHYYDGLMLSLFFNRWDGADDYAFWQHVSFDHFLPDLQDIDNPDQLIEVMSRQVKQGVQNAAKFKLQLEP